MVDVALHPEVKRFIDYVETNARKNGMLRFTIGFSEKRFLQNIWGPAMKYNFEGLYPEYPFIDHDGGQRFIDFLYVRGPVKVIVEIDGYTTHAKSISKDKFKDHLRRQNRLMYTGWFLLRFTADEIEQEADVCQAELLKAIGYCWSTASVSHPLKALETWHYRKQLLQLFASQEKGAITPNRFAQAHNISRSTAYRWIVKATKEGLFEPISRRKKVYAYRLVQQAS
ncbi:DUF559 domain-containing protein [Paenibacillus alkalitolerans]|uniref:DUF559 domain-containing protein n=1 Tax=Paenibacillus alkalitolerans TaxID=2799335 RepID=UPI0018F69BDD|nr:DUF559 domain-containing protein [Paenibacillus alkalitolerans]